MQISQRFLEGAWNHLCEALFFCFKIVPPPTSLVQRSSVPLKVVTCAIDRRGMRYVCFKSLFVAKHAPIVCGSGYVRKVSIASPMVISCCVLMVLRVVIIASSLTTLLQITITIITRLNCSLQVSAVDDARQWSIGYPVKSSAPKSLQSAVFFKAATRLQFVVSRLHIQAIVFHRLLPSESVA